MIKINNSSMSSHTATRPSAATVWKRCSKETTIADLPSPSSTWRWRRIQSSKRCELSAWHHGQYPVHATCVMVPYRCTNTTSILLILRHSKPNSSVLASTSTSLERYTRFLFSAQCILLSGLLQFRFRTPTVKWVGYTYTSHVSFLAFA